MESSRGSSQGSSQGSSRRSSLESSLASSRASSQASSQEPTMKSVSKKLRQKLYNSNIHGFMTVNGIVGKFLHPYDARTLVGITVWQRCGWVIWCKINGSVTKCL